MLLRNSLLSSFSGTPSTSPLAAGRALAGFTDNYPGAWNQSERTLGNHRFAGLQPLFNDGLLAYSLSCRNRSHFHLLVRLDDVNKGPVLSGLNSLVGDHSGVGPVREPKVDADELAGPKSPVRVCEGCFQLDGAGGRIDGVFEE